jgi:hypothetical protein
MNKTKKIVTSVFRFVLGHFPKCRCFSPIAYIFSLQRMGLITKASAGPDFFPPSLIFSPQISSDGICVRKSYYFVCEIFFPRDCDAKQLQKAGISPSQRDSVPSCIQSCSNRLLYHELRTPRSKIGRGPTNGRSWTYRAGTRGTS